jgi:hypothetical protein
MSDDIKGFDNQYQRVVSEGYPQGDLLPFDTSSGVETRRAVFTTETGDSLFNFVFHELSDVVNHAEAVERLEKGIRDLQACIDKLNAVYGGQQ